MNDDLTQPGPFVEAPTKELVYVAVRLVGDNSVQVPDGIFADAQSAAERCDEDARSRTHNRFGNVFDQDGVSYRRDLRNDTFRQWPTGSGYAIEQALVEVED